MINLIPTDSNNTGLLVWHNAQNKPLYSLFCDDCRSTWVAWQKELPEKHKLLKQEYIQMHNSNPELYVKFILLLSCKT